ncbi:acetyl esterase/lipase [Agromyces ramosus]|uniref:Acetyl esterase/lipase n=1 Tax=Agromyces ramosus TaxID=33879 RepID=A0A4Q7MLF4_9MICO|nr:alpha/beta hydrolase fold domain-containing protein [Agromyces ramosus]RZS68797.1 acetyl esterase/lipase [Agromyces ramosus]
MTQQTPFAAADGLVRVYPADAAGARPTPCLVWAHGGGFVAGDLDMPEADRLARTFAARGVTVVSIDYRLVGDGAGRYPAGSDDVLAAWRWTLEHAEELGLDSTRLAIGGASAGANLVTGAVLRLLGRAPAATGPALPAGVFLAYPTLLAVQPAPGPELRAALDANPAADRFGPDAVRDMYETYLGGSVDDAPLTAVPGLAEPSDVVGFPSTIVVNGDVDELRVSGELFAATLAAAGVPVELALEPGTEHGHLNEADEPAASATVDRVAAWIDRGFEPAASGALAASGHTTTT